MRTKALPVTSRPLREVSANEMPSKQPLTIDRAAHSCMPKPCALFQCTWNIRRDYTLRL